ncbi:ATP-binding protein [Chitinimonas sp. BJB300]|uniref:ATP-binding protein n=1 Tax=Chitinimonas sp. BJB300 TaxID=1559339 RepID=UPI000C0DACF4|nr:ATP-binding protein [Chitinimonas sp. BJB300]PHV11089.1 histidine kinase [Chitinimonas sp. BJB300]TSJ89692.1 histidine kinase [Chitinimonas sp. BJB300]
MGSGSIRTRLMLGAFFVLAIFLAGAGYALERAFAESTRSAHHARLQGDVYLLMAAAELDADGSLVMPPSLAEPRFSLPGSGLYANVANPSHREEWQSSSSLGLRPPFPRGLNAGQWLFDERERDGKRYLTAAYGVRWADGLRAQPLTFAVVEEDTQLQRELRRFRNTLWRWLGGAAFVLLLAQTLLLGWGLGPLRRVAREIRRIENGDQPRLEGQYPRELAALTDNLNALIEQERARQRRYKDALSDLAHSLKTPLAVLRGGLNEPATLMQTVEEQVARMDGIVQHQLGRAAASGASRFAPALLLAPVLQRIIGSLGKVYAERNLQIHLECPATLSWKLDEGDAFEVCGNVLDNAAKWASSRVRCTVSIDGRSLLICVEDDGPGFSDIDAALQRGVRLDEQVPGHGIGLTVVADIVAAYGGEISLTRSKLGGGQVEVRLPPA